MPIDSMDQANREIVLVTRNVPATFADLSTAGAATFAVATAASALPEEENREAMDQ